ncbi:MAG: hypothetical protein IAA73_01785 [Bacteroidetes bacterium]|uniref:Uncharacterized protein n=1 Tax=Candidatus Gallipaludibacter merdavium TaxID=2840839 RepID=A0A9D9HSQ0_9BACT|nr:hypothetical protein [Candidatus Gallipaludibacter merdavium]
MDLIFDISVWRLLGVGVNFCACLVNAASIRIFFRNSKALEDFLVMCLLVVLQNSMESGKISLVAGLGWAVMPCMRFLGVVVDN